MFRKILAVLLAVSCSLSMIACNVTPEAEDASVIEKTTIEDVLTAYDEELVPPTYSAEKEGYQIIYFDSINGDDANDGKSKENPKQSLSEIISVIGSVKEGTPTKILIKAGSSYEGTLRITSFVATEEYPLIISTYGQTETCKYAKFSGEPNCVEISRGNIRVSYLECTAIHGTLGIFVQTEEAGAMKNIVLSNNYIHDVNFDFESGLPLSLQGQGKLPGDSDVDDDLIDRPAVCATSKYTHGTGGIYFNTGTNSSAGPSWFENVWIENNKIERVSRDGVFINTFWARRPALDWGYNKYVSDEIGWYPNKNINFLYNDISYTGDCCYCPIAAVGGFIQGNRFYHAGYLMRPGFYSAAVFPHSSKNLVMQYNEAAYTHLYGGGDGEGFDLDMGCSNIIFQYNYSHHNEGGGLLLCSCWTKESLYQQSSNGKIVPILDEDGLPTSQWLYPYWGNNYIRNNVFADNDRVAFKIQGGIDDLYIYNNTIIVGGNSSSDGIVKAEVWGNANRKGKNYWFMNNLCILRNKRKTVFELDHCADAKVYNNIFCNFDDSLYEYLLDTESGYDFDVRYIRKYDITLNVADAPDGISNISQFVVDDDRVYTQGANFTKMAKFDFLGNLATNKYIGAFSAK